MPPFNRSKYTAAWERRHNALPDKERRRERRDGWYHDHYVSPTPTPPPENDSSIPPKVGILEGLPTELHHNIFVFLSWNDCLSVRRVSRYLGETVALFLLSQPQRLKWNCWYRPGRFTLMQQQSKEYERQAFLAQIKHVNLEELWRIVGFAFKENPEVEHVTRISVYTQLKYFFKPFGLKPATKIHRGLSFLEIPLPEVNAKFRIKPGCFLDLLGSSLPLHSITKGNFTTDSLFDPPICRPVRCRVRYKFPYRFGEHLWGEKSTQYEELNEMRFWIWPKKRFKTVLVADLLWSLSNYIGVLFKWEERLSITGMETWITELSWLDIVLHVKPLFQPEDLDEYDLDYSDCDDNSEDSDSELDPDTFNTPLELWNKKKFLLTYPDTADPWEDADWYQEHLDSEEDSEPKDEREPFKAYEKTQYQALPNLRDPQRRKENEQEKWWEAD